MRAEQTEENLADIYRTEPPDVVRRSLKRQIGEKLSSALMPFIQRAARPYLGGENVADALCVAERLTKDGFEVSLSYWDRGKEAPENVEAIAIAALSAMASNTPQSYLALKPPALRFSNEAARRIAAAAASFGVRLHFDSHGAEVVDRSNAMLDVMLEEIAPEYLGTTLPGRLMRSQQDAEWAIARGLHVRVVKGAWPDPSLPHTDLGAGFLDLIDRLAGRARYVAVATHDLKVGRAAIEKLREAGTPCEIEVLLGMPAKPLLEWAGAQDVNVRVYVPYGFGYIVNAVGVLRRNPHLLLAIAAQLLKSGR